MKHKRICHRKTRRIAYISHLRDQLENPTQCNDCKASIFLFLLAHNTDEMVPKNREKALKKMGWSMAKVADAFFEMRPSSLCSQNDRTEEVSNVFLLAMNGTNSKGSVLEDFFALIDILNHTLILLGEIVIEIVQHHRDSLLLILQEVSVGVHDGYHRKPELLQHFLWFDSCLLLPSKIALYMVELHHNMEALLKRGWQQNLDFLIAKNGASVVVRHCCPLLGDHLSTLHRGINERQPICLRVFSRFHELNLQCNVS
mmetsp:Transcript_30874/g.48091  ORF Transcript_30874/g.48091 Transcript_30874/m.48091 type:complete len:257 (+) Transcript_30874:3415-4185(+)